MVIGLEYLSSIIKHIHTKNKIIKKQNAIVSEIVNNNGAKPTSSHIIEDNIPPTAKNMYKINRTNMVILEFGDASLVTLRVALYIML